MIGKSWKHSIYMNGWILFIPPHFQALKGMYRPQGQPLWSLTCVIFYLRPPFFLHLCPTVGLLLRRQAFTTASKQKHRLTSRLPSLLRFLSFPSPLSSSLPSLSKHWKRATLHIQLLVSFFFFLSLSPSVTVLLSSSSLLKIQAFAKAMKEKERKIVFLHVWSSPSPSFSHNPSPHYFSVSLSSKWRYLDIRSKQRCRSVPPPAALVLSQRDLNNVGV